MIDSIINLIIGNLGEKKVYLQLKKRANALPEPYRFAYRKIQHYIYSVGCPDTDLTIFTDLVSLFEESAAEGRQVFDVIGSDIGAFCDELIRASSANSETVRETLNKEILAELRKEPPQK